MSKLRLTIEVDGVYVDDINELIEMMKTDFGYEDYSALEILSETMEPDAVLAIVVQDGEMGHSLHHYDCRIVGAEVDDGADPKVNDGSES